MTQYFSSIADVLTAYQGRQPDPSDPTQAASRDMTGSENVVF